MKEEREKWEEIIHSKLYDFETDVGPDDWDVIFRKLSGGKAVRLSPYRRYASVAAAVVAVLLVVGGIWFYPYHNSGQDVIAVTERTEMDSVVNKPDQNRVEKEIPVVEKSTDIFADPVEKQIGKPVKEKLSPVEKAVDKPVKRRVAPVEKNADNLLIASAWHPGKKLQEKRVTLVTTEPPLRLKPLKIDEADSISVKRTDADVENQKEKNMLLMQKRENIKPKAAPYEEPLIADASTEVKRRRWGFGMGGGSYSINSSSVSTAPLTLSSLQVRDESMMKEVMRLNNNSKEAVDYNSPQELRTYAYEIPSGKVKHKVPISAGLGVSYFLSDRWSLQSGVTYTFLRSEWNSDYTSNNYAEYKQNLHFIGIPLSVSYQIAEWKHFQLYASTGGICEFNVAGEYKETLFSENLKKISNKNLRMKRPMWSVNTRAGVSYPLWKFINIYAEAGASYYFDNKSDIETIRSDKPFNVSLQAGIRFGF
jgi:opacity protein-like surface antigen